MRYGTIETKDPVRIGYTKCRVFLFHLSTNSDKKKQLLCFNSNVCNLYNTSVVEKTNGMTFNPTTT